MEFQHYSVLLHECLEGLSIRPDGIYADGTAGGAGHSKEIAKRLTSGRLLALDRDPEAVKVANVIYTDVWVSMGEPVEVWEERIRELAPYQVNTALMDAAEEDVVFMHCLPAFHDDKTGVGKEMGERFGRDSMEVTDEVFESERSVVFREAENRMHTIKAVMAATLGAVK